MSAARRWVCGLTVATLASVGVPAAVAHWRDGALARSSPVVVGDVREHGDELRSRVAVLTATSPVSGALAAFETAAAGSGLRVDSWDACDTSTPGSALTTQSWTVALSSATGSDLTTISLEQLIATVEQAPVALDVTHVTASPHTVVLVVALTQAG